MSSADSPYGQLAQGASLCTPVGPKFAIRPTLRGVAARIIQEQWSARRLGGAMVPGVVLVRTQTLQRFRYDNLADVLIERYRRQQALNLDSDLDYLAILPETGHLQVHAVEADLHGLEVLINECGPLLLDEYKRALSEFWFNPTEQGSAPWQWLTDYLQAQFRRAAEAGRDAGDLDGLEVGTAMAVAWFPAAAHRAPMANLAQTQVRLLSLDVSQELHLNPELASAVIIERSVPERGRTVVLLYTLAGKLYRFDARQGLAQALLRGGESNATGPFTLHLCQTELSVFEAQARLLLEQQLALIDLLAQHPAAADEDPVEALVSRIDEATSLIEISLRNRKDLDQLFQQALPAWMRDAGAADTRQYIDGLIRLANVQLRTAGRSYLHGVLPINEFARNAMHLAIRADHAAAGVLDLDKVEVVNRQVTAASSASGGNPVVSGAVKEVALNLEQFALANVAALRPGSVSVRWIDGRAAPAWLTVDYLKGLVSRLDCGAAYPALLQAKLLDDPVESAGREHLFIEQLREQLPLLAMEQYLSKTGGISAVSVKRIGALTRPGLNSEDIVRLRPLSFIRKPGAAADVALNAFLIEGVGNQSEPVLLYRPLHRQSLLEFESRQALFEQICEDAALQADILMRLDETVQAVYAKGGFEEPHIARFFLGDEFSPPEVPAPAQLGMLAIAEQTLEHLYRSTVAELIARARAQSVSTSESRWQGYQELGWLMFNTVLPLLSGPVATATWMVQFLATLQTALQRPSEVGNQQGLADLLFNLALMLYAYRTHRSGGALSPASEVSTVPMRVVEVQDGALEQARTSPSGAALARLDFGWATAGQRLSAEQATQLRTFRSDLSVAQLGLPIPHGQWKGLYLVQEQFWALIDGGIYALSINADEVRITDSAGRGGPWLRQDGEQRWQFDVRPRLRGGMPLKGRVEQLREANRLRVLALEQADAAFNARRVEQERQLHQDLEQIAAQEIPDAELLKQYKTHLLAFSNDLKQAHENFLALNQLKAQKDFSRTHAIYLFNLGKYQTLEVLALRHQFADSATQMRALGEVQGTLNLIPLLSDPRTAAYQRLVVLLKQSAALADEIVECYQAIAALKAKLAATPPLGGGFVGRLEALAKNESGIKAWRSTQIRMMCALTLESDRTVGAGHLLLNSLQSARLALQTQIELDRASDFTHQQRIDLLNSSARLYAGARESLRSFAEGVSSDDQRSRLSAYENTLVSLQQDAESELAASIRELPEQREPPGPVLNPKREIIRTRNKGYVVGQRRAGKGGKPDMVVVTEAIENTDLARYTHNVQADIWEPVLPPAKAPQVTANLKALLAESARLLLEAPRHLQRARAQARTASVPVEMEEILTQRARPLDALSLQIEQALTRSNATDSLSGGQDAAVQAKALSDMARQMREAGRTLRIEMIKAQPPTVGRVAYLKAQGQVSIARLEARKASRPRKGYSVDYLQEYVVRDQAMQPLWYAHFHYASLQAADTDFVVAHLKTREQRFDAGQYRLSGEKDNQKVIEVYRSRIDKASAAKLFLDLV
ncbi:hypothetical protein [Pseudomonas fontis]|uniref:Uncharacterized protein n=1 Tax=Pseudomonas fontis TaxID=2942633 RepID=A0ABT5NUB3_9PSED|nr:hypothetical protein [Pseudomonas fontis]MDD0973929.1 hypothetical protein [Pseudomonas fontis]MDD0991771.1 hypothetical protein [Pseudomonas fontis]